MSINKTCIFLTVMAVSLILSSCGEGSAGPSAPSGWRRDIAWISDSLPLLHYDLFMYVPEDSLTARLSRLEADLDSLSDMETAMELTRILASMRCSHTGITFWDQCEIRAYPISVIWLDEPP